MSENKSAPKSDEQMASIKYNTPENQHDNKSPSFEDVFPIEHGDFPVSD